MLKRLFPKLVRRKSVDKAVRREFGNLDRIRDDASGGFT
jgi:hypothetical protein